MRLNGFTALRSLFPLVALSLSALAQAAPVGGWTLGLRGGLSLSDAQSAKLDSQLAARGHAVSTRIDKRDTALIGSLGYQLSPLFSLEASGGSLGNYDVRLSGSSTRPAALPGDLAELKPAGGLFIGLGVRQDLPITGKLSLTTRLGGIAWRQESEVTGTSGSEKIDDQGLGVMTGAALKLALGGHWGLSLGGDWFYQNERGSIGVAQAGLEYRFGQ
ncbi:hypothetical protein ED208_13905 [Stagnimonas aquatica]|uniref:Uncharacterized protein n=1 Tax=Stagnimonas aquatica TaxID=2689987 RepID=A0A3N0V516_9GAMM|nr:outer membrane beta-barrel protein [Stagnimonas aquatica]ROH87803.1 hypothetical protein ED208_13905 [Stagnimonas aquatica]